jgi:hypothetical protein
MQRRAWKIIVRVPGLEGKPGWNEYFVVKDSDRMSALAALLRARPDLVSYAYEFQGEASQDFFDWVEPDNLRHGAVVTPTKVTAASSASSIKPDKRVT